MSVDVHVYVYSFEFLLQGRSFCRSVISLLSFSGHVVQTAPEHTHMCAQRSMVYDSGESCGMGGFAME